MPTATSMWSRFTTRAGESRGLSYAGSARGESAVEITRPSKDVHEQEGSIELQESFQIVQKYWMKESLVSFNL